MKSLILDFETTSTDPNAAVLEIGCIAVNRKTFRPIAQLDLRPEIFTQLADRRQLDPDTIQWHVRKKTLPTTNGTLSLATCTLNLTEFITLHNPYRIWAWGKDFERPLIENICKAAAIQIPSYQFRKFACARDQWQNAFGMETEAPERTHHALQDCLDELRDLRSALKALKQLHNF